MTELWVNKGCSKNLASKSKQKDNIYIYFKHKASCEVWRKLSGLCSVILGLYSWTIASGLKSQVLPKSKNLRVKAGSIVRLFVCEFYFEIETSSRSLSM